LAPIEPLLPRFPVDLHPKAAAEAYPYRHSGGLSSNWGSRAAR
jgi:hypothetical protein